MNLRIEFAGLSVEKLEERLHESLPDDWSRDGILEHQITTQDPVQYCFRRRRTDAMPRAAVCLSGTKQVLTDAAVVPVDRGPELSDDQRDELLSDFVERVLRPALESTDKATITLSRDAAPS